MAIAFKLCFYEAVFGSLCVRFEHTAKLVAKRDIVILSLDLSVALTCWLLLLLWVSVSQVCIAVPKEVMGKCVGGHTHKILLIKLVM